MSDQLYEADKSVKVSSLNINLTKEIFGALSQDETNPLSRVSVANSSFSIDPFRGCPAGCAYCTVAGALRDVNINDIKEDIIVTLPKKPEMLFSGQELALSLISHPAFIPNKSIISIGSGSTESFLPKVEEQTWAIMNTFLKKKLKNPFWIVTKMGISDDISLIWRDRFSLLLKNGIQTVISVTFAAHPKWVEPFNGDRFHNMDIMKTAGVKISHHLRPIIEGINDSDECIQQSLKDSLSIAEVVCVGGLRKDPGVALAWSHIYNLDSNLLPDDENRQKIISDKYIASVEKHIQDIGLEIPVVQRSSEMLSFLLHIPEYNLYRYRPDDTQCLLSVPTNIQSNIKEKYGVPIDILINQISKNVGLENFQVILRGNEVMLTRNLLYQEHRVLIHAIGHSEILP